MLDVAYALVLERDERVVMALVAAGADLSQLAGRREEFDASLEAPPVLSTLDPEQVALRRALGVA